MKLVTVSGPRGAGITEILKRVQEAFPGILHYAERNECPFNVLQDSLTTYPYVIIEATPEEVRKLHLITGRKDAMLRIFVSAPLEERKRRLRAALGEHNFKVVLQALLGSDPVPAHPPRLRQPIFDLLVHHEEGKIEAVSSRAIRAVGKFTGLKPVLSIQ